MSEGRPLARLITCVGLLVLGVVAADRLRVLGAGDSTSDSISLGLVLPHATDPEDVASRHAVVLEAAARSVGGALGTRGNIGASSLDIVVTFERGTDVRLKAVLLESELGPWRATLPAGAVSWVRPSSAQHDPAALVLLGGRHTKEEAAVVALNLEGLPGVRRVALAGASSSELAIDLPSRLASPGTVSAVESVVAAGSMPTQLGSLAAGGHVVGVVTAPAADVLRSWVTVGGVPRPLAAFARAAPQRAMPQREILLSGRPCVALEVYPSDGASLLRLDRDLRRFCKSFTEASGGLTLEILESRVSTLSTAIYATVLALALLTLAAASCGMAASGTSGALRLGLLPPLAVAVMLNVMWLLHTEVTTGNLSPLLAGVVLGLPIGALRILRGGFANGASLLMVTAAALLLPLAVTLGAGGLAPQVEPAFRALSVGAFSAVAAAYVLPTCQLYARRRRAAILLHALRDPGTLLLIAVTLTFALLVTTGTALDPRGSASYESLSRLLIECRLPRSATLNEAREQEAVLSRILAGASQRGIRRWWSVVQSDVVNTVVETDDAHTGPRALALLQSYLTDALPTGSRAVVSRASAHGAASGVHLDSAGREQASTDDDALRYRVVLRTQHSAALATALDRMRTRLAGVGVGSMDVRAAWTAPSATVELIPRADVRIMEQRLVAAALAYKSSPRQALEIPGSHGARIVVTSDGRYRMADDVPTRSEMLEQPLVTDVNIVVPSSLGVTSEFLTAPQIPWESGRFVLPVTITLRKIALDARRELRASADRTLATLALPEGTDLERPDITRSGWSPDDLRLLALAALLPLLLFALAAIRLDSVALGLCVLVPALFVLGIAAATLFMGRTNLDQGALVGLAGTTTLVVAIAVHLVSTVRLDGRRASVPRAVWRSIRRAIPGTTSAWIWLALVAWCVGGTEASLLQPVRLAALWMMAGLLACVSALPALVLGVTHLAWQRTDEARDLHTPPQWADSTQPARLEVRSVTKDYRGGVRALRGVSFTLEPGVTGLLGRNGAGKTTLLRVLTGLVEPTRGEVSFQGVRTCPANMHVLRRHIGFLPQEFNAHPRLTAEQFLEYWAFERGLLDVGERRRQIAELLTLVGLQDHVGRRVRDFSGGMRQRMGIARALLGAPSVLIVDEPTTGLDIESRTALRSALLEIGRDRIVLLSTHLAADVEAVASRLLVLQRGSLAYVGTPSDLITIARGRVFEMVIPDRDLREVSLKYTLTARVRVLAGIRVRGVAPRGTTLPGESVEPTLEEAYLAL